MIIVTGTMTKKPHGTNQRSKTPTDNEIIAVLSNCSERHLRIPYNAAMRTTDAMIPPNTICPRSSKR
jgi:hypothetical protein